ncbi:MAG: hypothetical protein Q7K41_03700, partial [Dehalococcoidales bacterium]|nr:hypothetical protein [Dehalococcoidales bacterium]
MSDIKRGLKRREFVEGSTRTGVITPVMIRRIAGAIVVAGFLAILFFAVLPTAPLIAAPEAQAPLECLNCHTRALQSHDKLGEGSAACWVCHDNTSMYILRLMDNTQVSMTNSPQVCGQCHPTEYKSWDGWTHGVLAAMEGQVPGLQAARPRCVYCHDPHRPQLTLPATTKPPPTSLLGEGPFPCLSCHVKVLKGHDKLGEGNQACWSCHYSAGMGTLHLSGGEQIALSDYPKLCAQCHQSRYQDWVDGTHGVPGWKEGELEVRGSVKTPCIACHSP